MLQKESAFIWNSISILNNFQFAYRLLGVICFVTAIIAGFASTYLKQKVLVVVVVVAIGITILNWGNRGIDQNVSDSSLQKNLPLSTWQEEGNGQSVPKWVDPSLLVYRIVPKTHLELLSGSATIRQVSRTNTNHTYVIQAESPVVLKENTQYFPGWHVFANDKETPFTYMSKKYLGLFIFSLPAGLHNIRVTYVDTPDVRFGKIISGLSLLMLIGINICLF